MEHSPYVLSEKQYKEFEKVMRNPPPPTEACKEANRKLKDLVKRYKK